MMSEHQYAILFSIMFFLVMVIVVVYGLYLFFKSDLWSYVNTPKQKVWTPDFLLKGEELRIVRRPFSYPGNKVLVVDYDYKHEVITSNEDVIIYWRQKDFCEAKRLYETQIMAES